MTKETLTGNLAEDAQFILNTLIQLSTNEHFNLGDKVYDVREREGKGWEGPSVVSFGEAAESAQAIVDKYKQQTPPDYTQFYNDTIE